MSCPDWRSLTAHRMDPPMGPEAEEPAGWGEALAHLDSCRRCRPAALAADPSLLFRRLVAPVSGFDEADSVRQAVAAMRRGRELERRPGANRSRKRWARWAAAAMLALAAISVTLLGGFDLTSPSPVPLSDQAPNQIAARASGPFADLAEPAERADPTAAGEPASALMAGFDLASAAPALESMPLVDGLDRPQTRLYQMASDGLAVVMIVDEHLDV